MEDSSVLPNLTPPGQNLTRSIVWHLGTGKNWGRKTSKKGQSILSTMLGIFSDDDDQQSGGPEMCEVHKVWNSTSCRTRIAALICRFAQPDLSLGMSLFDFHIGEPCMRSVAVVYSFGKLRHL